MRLHRQLFAASRLLQKKTALPKVLELMQSAVGGVDSALNVASPSAAVLADEIYDSRQYAISQNLIIVVPDIPRQTLSVILRGRIEDISGWTYYQQNNPGQSVVRLKRALSVLPDKSAWWRESQWHLGKALEADGKEKEALDAYLKSYDKDLPDLEKRAVIEVLYQKVNGNTDGLEAKIGTKSETLTTVAATENKTETGKTDNVKTPFSVPIAETSPTPKTEATPQPTPEVKTETKPETNPLPENLPSVTPKKTPEVSVSPTPDEKSKTEEVKTEEITTLKTAATPNPTPGENPKTEVQPTPASELLPKTEETKIIETKTEPTPESSPTPQNVSNVKTEAILQFPPSPKTNKPPSDKKSTEPTPSNMPKPLFEPIIINVGKTDVPKTDNPKTETKITDEKPSEPVQTEIKPTETPTSEARTSETKTPETPTEEKILTGENRPRIIITENTGTKTVTEEITSCKIIVSRETVSLLGRRGSMGVEVSFENGGDLKQIIAASSSPGNIEVSLDSDIGKDSKKLFFIVKSVSNKTGAFTVMFEAPCGKKEILVKVR
ncbi:MAG: hypothetical protein ABJA66_12560, partial [Actinomycetota bacterium]